MTARPRQTVLVMTDATRWDMLGCYRDTGLRTPHLDQLAASGVRFERAYTTQPVCAPARSALFTGTWPHTNGTWANSQAPALDIPTLGQRFRDAGVPAAYVGKWHLDGTDYFGNGRCPDGWDERYWYDMRCYLEELTLEQRPWSRDPRSSSKPGVTSEITFAHRCSDRAVDFIEQHADEDFLLVVSYDEPHDPAITPPEYASRYEGFEFPDDPNTSDDLQGKPEHQRVWAGDRLTEDRSGGYHRRFDQFFAAQEYVDSQINRVLTAVAEHAPDALVGYTSDHGDMLGSHRLYAKGPSMYDEIARVPFILRLPAAGGTGVHAHPVSHIDFAPTVLEHAGLPIPDIMPGRSLLPALRDPATPVNDVVFTEFGRYEVDHDGFGGFQPMRGVFDGRHKLVVHLLSTDELYDLEQDPDELVNLIDDPARAAVRDALHDRILQWMNDTRDPFRGYYWERRPWRTSARPATWDYDGMTRQRPADPGYQPAQLDYDTGLEATEAVRRKNPLPVDEDRAR